MTTTDAPASPREFVLVDGDGREVHRYTQKGAANRRAKTIRGARVLTAADWEAELEFRAGAANLADDVAALVTRMEDETPAGAAPDGLGAPDEEDAEFMDYVADAPEQTLNDLDVVSAFLASMAERAEDDFPQSETVVIHWPVRDVDEMTGTDWPEVRKSSGAPRLASGALGGMVEDYLTEHEGDFGPGQISKALGRSSGAVANALERLVVRGAAVRVPASTRRYARASEEA